MPYLLPQKKLAVFFSPKAAGTSVRAFLFELENGFPLMPYQVQGCVHDLNTVANQLVVNNRFRLVDHAAIADFERIALVRDPVRRLLSAYSNRVLHYRELSEEAAGPALAAADLAPDPDIDLFMANIARYMQISKSIARHFSHQEVFLGKSRDYFSKLFLVEDMGSFETEMNRHFGAKAKVPRLQDGGPKIDFHSLAPATRERIMAYVGTSVIFDWVKEYREAYADADLPV
ncbi:sulfotransferase family 2 domain-containing protein [Rhodobacter calidifons]|uniref:Sulfotransferase family protein n=1 Tax=Rhodobacter calidifons TaxID=2715277 RepID=A0ABX0G3R0_9RHOB|nr:sulfotransferase family 2 domain-containing protein [Rhodobacter calidifons]NHB75592.1 sulfotransferase family protein [Rhodobacter calidifons]